MLLWLKGVSAKKCHDNDMVITTLKASEIFYMRFVHLFFFILVLSVSPRAIANSDLPVLTDAASSTISLDQEHRLGRAWVRSLRGSVKLLDDPLAVSYLHDLSWELVGHSQLQDRRIDLVVVDNQTFNAFAVPGGIIGIHGGLLLAAEREDELASVLAHELAHLSQRHYAASLEESRRNRPLAIASFLASVLIAAADSQAGAAAISTSIAAQQSARLSFSRQNEREADRVGMQTLVSAGIDPSAMPRMFSRMQASQRFLSKPPEFLLTHPVTEARIADSLNRAERLGKPPLTRRSIEFAAVKARMAVYYESNPQTAYNHFQDKHRSSGKPEDLYAFAVAATRLSRPDQAKQALAKLPDEWRKHLFTQLTGVEADIAALRWGQAAQTLDGLAAVYPGNFAVEQRRAEAYMGAGLADKAVQVLNDLKREYPNDVTTHYLLAEALGQSGRNIAVHEARIDYFLLTGQIDRALTQVQYAHRERNLTASDKARIDQLEQDVKQVRAEMEAAL